MAGNSSESEDLRRVSRQVAARLAARGVVLSGSESADQLTSLEEAVERFEQAVEAHGGDLMVDEAPAGHVTEPDDAHFALPVRHEHEAVAAYIERLDEATDVVQRHRGKDTTP